MFFMSSIIFLVYCTVLRKNQHTDKFSTDIADPQISLENALEIKWLNKSWQQVLIFRLNKVIIYSRDNGGDAVKKLLSTILFRLIHF